MVEGIAKVGSQDPTTDAYIDGLLGVGDFGLATSSLAAAVEPSELVPPAITADAEMTLGSSVPSSHLCCAILII
jgi:hypothetical protein